MWREPRPNEFKHAVDGGYCQHIQPYHSWLPQNIFFAAVAVVPTWQECHERLAAFDAEGEAGVLRCVEALEPVVERIESSLRTRQLWDTRQI